MKERKKIIIPYRGEHLTPCAKCQQMMFFSRTAAGKLMPVNYDGDHANEPHFANCPFAGDFRKGKK